jgi:DNA repair exonuclease SbcCD ATPase subunit
MYTPIRLTAKNFLSFRELDYSFQYDRAVLVQGINLTDKGSKSNGSGKSSIQEMIYFAYIGDTSRSVSMKKLIRRGEDTAEVSLFLHNGNELLEIKRDINLKGSSGLVIIKNGEVLRFATVNDGNKMLREIIGITADDFKNFFLVNRGNYKSFFRLSDADKKEFIGRFSGAEKIKKVYPVIEKYIAEVENDKASIVSMMKELEVKIEATEDIISQLELSRQEFNPDVHICTLGNDIEHLEHEQEKLAHQIDELNSVQYEEQSKEWTKKSEIFRNQIKRLEKLSFDAEVAQLEIEKQGYKDRYKKVKTEIDKLESYQDEVKIALGEVDNLLQTSIECPECGHLFSLQDENFNEEEIQNERKELSEGLESAKFDLKDVLTEKNKINTKISRTDEEISVYDEMEKRKRTLIYKTNRNLQECNVQLGIVEKAKIQNKNSIIMLENSIFMIDSQIESKEQEIENLKANEQAKKFDDLICKKEKELKGLRNEHAEYELDLQDTEIILSEKKNWLLNFKRFYSFLSNYSLKCIQDRANSFLDRMGTNLLIQIEGFKQLQSGDLREQISVNVLRDGMLEGAAAEFSAGEQGRLECAMILTNQQIINETCNIGGGLNFIAIDEILDSIDEYGMMGIIDSLQNVNKTILLTSHIQINEVIDNEVLTVIKENGESYIK